jgi:hypothetical protein
MDLTIVLEKGTIVHLNGIPIELKEATPVVTRVANVSLLFYKQEMPESASRSQGGTEIQLL